MARLTKYQRWDRDNLIHRALFGPGIANVDDVLRTFEEGMLVAGKLTLLFWFEKILPDHFTRSAHNRYGYHDRKARYIKFKRLKFPESKGLDLVMTGRFRDTILANPRSVPTGKRVMKGFVFKIGLRSQPYIVRNQYVDMHQEITARDEIDVTRLLEVLRAFVRYYLGFGSL